MKLRLISLALACTLLLAGCSWPDGSYHSVTPHREQTGTVRTENLTVSDYTELLAAMEAAVAKGTESFIIYAVNQEPEALELNLGNAAWNIRNIHPVGAYAVEDIHYEVGSNTGKTAVSVSISYRHSRTEIRRIRTVHSAQEVREQIGDALKKFETSLVLQMESYQELDVQQMVRDYALECPQEVMEIPQVAVEICGLGRDRVIEMTFSYQTSREVLRTMQSQVQIVFDSAALYVSGEGAHSQKFSQLYAFLMERFDYKLETSITPAYSLLRHGVGDSRAFATVYAAMCRASGLDCTIVTGTRSGEPWTWNIICEDGAYRHVDLLQCNESGKFGKKTDPEMDGYVWDYSACPPCVEIPEEETQPKEK